MTPHRPLPGPGARAHTLAWLAVRSRTSTRTTRVLILAVASAAVVLGVCGFLAADMDLGPLDVAYGVAAMFVLAGTNPGDDLPLTLEVARLLAPLATAGATLALLAALGHGRLNRAAARRARHHLVLIGAAERVGQHVDGAADRLVVHHRHGASDGLPGAIHVTHPPLTSADRLDVVGAGAADRIVVATGHDDVSVALLGPLTSLTSRVPTIEVTVEIDDSPTASALATALVTQSPANHIQIVCREDLAAELAAARALGAIDRNPPPGDGTDRADDFGTTVALVGSGPDLRRLGAYVGESLRRAYPGGGRAPRPTLWFVTGNDTLRHELAATMTDPVNLDVHLCSALEDLAAVVGPMIVVVAHEDASQSMRTAVQVKARFPSAEVCVRSRASEPAIGLVPINLDAAKDVIDVGGPWARAAAQWCAETGGSPWATKTRAEQRADVSEIRMVLHRLLGLGWRLTPRRGVWDGAVMLPVAAMTAIGDTALKWRDFPWLLPSVGFSLLAPGSRPTDAVASTAAAALRDDQVEVLARLGHEAYQRSIAPEPSGRAFPAADSGWDTLERHYRAQNIQQVRHAVMRIHAAGLVVVPAEPDPRFRDVDISDELVEELARAEHDRWARLKRAQGFRYGPELVTEGAKRHPDLVAWEDLDGPADDPELRRDKDRAPMRSFAERLRHVGLRIAVPANRDN